MLKTMDYIIEGPDKKGRTYIIEGEKRPNMIFSINRFMCEVQKQQTEKDTRLVAEIILQALVTREAI